VFHIGNQRIDSRVLLAPMAGVTDLPFRRLCRRFGAGLTTSEMLTSDITLWRSRKSSSRLRIEAQSHPISMQIAGSEPVQLAQAAKACQEAGAEIIDINMGCPAKKVCKKLAGSALLADEALVEKILYAVVEAVNVPVTLKTRTGPSLSDINADKISHIAEQAGVAAFALHGRTRACRFKGDAEHKTARDLSAKLSIPLIINGDIDSAQKALTLLENTNAEAVMVGRAALGQPWLIQDIKNYIETGTQGLSLSTEEKLNVVLTHLNDIYEFYGEFMGVRIARKHFGWYCNYLPNGKITSKTFNQLDSSAKQIQLAHSFFRTIKDYEDEAA